MESDSWRWVAIGILIFLNAFFVAAEYALVGSRAGRIDALARRGVRAARAVARALDDLPRYIAGIQLAITMAGIGLGWTAETTIAPTLEPLLKGVGLHVVASLLAFLLVTFLLVVLGELVPKYMTIRDSERIAVRIIHPLNAGLFLLKPLTAVLQGAGYLALRPLGIDMSRLERPIVAKEELAALVRESQTAGVFDEAHAKMVTKALRLTDLQADDVMIPRVDIVYVDAGWSRDELLRRLAKQSHTRLMAVEAGDLDEVVGILHLQDAIRLFSGEAENLRSILRPAVFIPPTLSLERVVEMMREQRTQMLIVRDEHGGTEGLLTLEDVVEEVFGELDDQVEHAQPRIERRPDGRVFMRGDVRTDELAEFLNLEENPLEREPVATIILERLDRTPRLGDVVKTPLGSLRVDNMARQRITRVSLIQVEADGRAPTRRATDD
ncbi:MAG: HlyC/CorC family transporter [Armatimonadetes bacterium]|nr:HlyC/CorC family transporter [Armatimonadota bacterium]